MIQFNRLRINGFKSFVDRTELEIGPGLNGVVGPNGCGKSNLVEALRWIMGENSAKRMRGGGMEDVIFNGTEKRSKRNIAEVSLLMDNSSRSAPAAYNNSDELEIIRKIERDRGSNYKINGKNVRARDVQMLFADTVTGANSPAMVSQGRVTQMINAKPLDRRLILEESAGISGLFARRHEAELRLKAADANLVRMEDILGGLEGRLNSLKRQARQATRYRNISTQIRQFEILIAYMEWKALDERTREVRAKFNEAESQVVDRLAVVTQLTKTQTTQATDLPALRQKEAESAAALQTQKLALQRIEDEAERQEQILREAQDQMEQTKTDHAHEQQGLEDSTQALERAEKEQETILKEQETASGRLSEKTAIKDELEEKVLELEAQYNALMQTTAEMKAQKESLAQRIENNNARIETLQGRHDSAQEELKELSENDGMQGHATQDFENTIEKLERDLRAAQEKLTKTNEERDALGDAIEAQREKLQAAEAQKSEFIAEIKVLEDVLDSDESEDYSPILGEMKPQEGFEKALSRALGDSLMASLDDKANSTWLTRTNPLAALPDLPKGATALLPHVDAPQVLQAALSQIGVVDTEADGHELWNELQPGQALVSKDGMYWRWDGYCVKAEAADRNARHLEQKNKLASLNKKRPKIESQVEAAQKALEDQQKKQEQLKTLSRETAEHKTALETSLMEQRTEWASMREEHARLNSEKQRLQDLIKTSKEDIEDLQKTIKDDERQLRAFEENAEDNKAEQLEQLKETLTETRQAHSEAVRAFDMIQQQQNTREARLRAIADERISQQNRSIRGRERLKQLSERKEALAEKLETLKAQPSDFEGKKEELLSKIAAAEKQRDQDAEKLAACEAEVTETGKALKEAEGELGEAREARAHAQATLSAIAEQQESLVASIEEKFEMKPEKLPEHSAIDMDKEFGDLESLRQKKDKITRERDAIGPVNLRAEEEMQELEKEVGTMLHERNDLIQAIEELRTGIQKINKEARERLLVAFDHVNAHFQRLFVQLFGGGKAHLALIDSDDPLNSGLEIFAEPPGKSLQSLSLLSGGEQTLASIALIFAMFLTNPSPICVLDEIDAPLDDANVDRVCDLLDEIAERGETRFLVITHHRLTMARMDRLYGVTMAEKGVSQLVSVDLQQSFDFVEAA